MSAPKVDVGCRADTLPTAYPIWVIVAPANQSTPLGLLSCFGSAFRLSEADKVSVSAPIRAKYKGITCRNRKLSFDCCHKRTSATPTRFVLDRIVKLKGCALEGQEYLSLSTSPLPPGPAYRTLLLSRATCCRTPGQQW